MALTRFSTKQTSVVMDTTAAASTEIEFRGYATGTVFIPAAATTTILLTWYAAEEPGGTYLAARDGAGNAVTSTVAASQAVPIPSSLSGAGAIKATANAVATVIVCLKG